VIELRVDGAVEGECPPGSVVLLETCQRRAAGERQVHGIAWDQLRRDVLEIAALQLGEGDGRVDVVKGGEATRRRRHPVSDGHPFGHVGTDDHGIGTAHVRGETLFELPNI
jgi:hypothetical protein